MPFQLLKADASRHVVYGWASVSVKDGDLVTDLQGDQIEPECLEQAVEDFMLEYRAGTADGAGVMHETAPKCEVIASLVTTPDIVKAFGLGDNLPIGWILGLKVLDEATWQRVVSGELKAFSIQGTAEKRAA